MSFSRGRYQCSLGSVGLVFCVVGGLLIGMEQKL
jgi:hypothetical protein